MIKANNPIHCALSLVGEPIMYPHINEFVDYLHDKGISTYLVTNAQFPDAIATLPPITQVNNAPKNPSNKVGCVFPMVIWPDIRIKRYRDSDYGEDTPNFSFYLAVCFDRWKHKRRTQSNRSSSSSRFLGKIYKITGTYVKCLRANCL